MAKKPAPRKKTAKEAAKPVAVEYHIVPNGRRWDVERDDTFTGSFAYDMNVAVGVAISDAQRDQHNGLSASVCVQQPDGSCRHVWP